ncbi:hypothetical protein Awo_c32260 [Acetobacterium woodii DSM 1030]|uniref:N-acetyltransferase domain-containing protein n=2 Tax=Acetobacterium woodii TaxID=33952 RepID=H6LK34_ACEWD|nr:hypothetical protein Awo_c32260 [Acetobacterium woodii DSM 1030]
MAEKRFLKFKEGVITAYAEKKLVGFISFFSVMPAVHQRALLQQEYIDDNLNAEEIKPLTKEASNSVLLFDHVIDPDYRGQGISRLLVESAREYLKQKNIEGYVIENIFAFAISVKGRQILLSLGGKTMWIKDDITCLELDREIFLGLI